MLEKISLIIFEKLSNIKKNIKNNKIDYNETRVNKLIFAFFLFCYFDFRK